MTRAWQLARAATLWTILVCTTAVTSQSTSGWQVEFDPAAITVEMEKHVNGTLRLSQLTNVDQIESITLVSLDQGLMVIDPELRITGLTSNSWTGPYNVKGVFLGKSSAALEVKWKSQTSTNQLDKTLVVTVIRENRWIDHAFTGTVALLVSIMYINFGAAIQLDKLKQIVVRPIGPAIGFFCQFVIMPLLSYGLGILLFPDNHAMQLGMFFTGVSPAGGASNIWTVILGGNMDLSVTMTTISTFAAFGMMPLWIFTLGGTIFDQAGLKVPYTQITTYAVCLVIPLGIGMLIQRYLPRVGRILVRILKPFSTLLIVFIVIFAIVSNLYIFQLFSWQIIVAGMGLPWVGFLSGWIAAKLFRSVDKDALAISVETGVQNTGIAIYLLRFSLAQPEGDLTTVVPVSVAIMTPIPLTLLYICQLIRRRYATAKDDAKHGADLTILGQDQIQTQETVAEEGQPRHRQAIAMDLEHGDSKRQI